MERALEEADTLEFRERSRSRGGDHVETEACYFLYRRIIEAALFGTGLLSFQPSGTLN